MKRPPRRSDEHLFSLRSIGLALLQGGTVLAACIGVFLLAGPSGGMMRPAR